MNTEYVISRLLSSPGIKSVLFHGEARKNDDSEPAIDGLALQCILNLAKHVQMDARAIVGMYTITCVWDEQAPIVIAIKTGDPIVKSLRRMISRTLRIDRKPTHTRQSKPALNGTSGGHFENKATTSVTEKPPATGLAYGAAPTGHAPERAVPRRDEPTKVTSSPTPEGGTKLW